MYKLLVFAALIALASCSGASKSGAPLSDVAPTLAGVRAAIVAGNYGEAAQIARNYIQISPKDPDGYYEDARAEALASNQSNALVALTKAVDYGLASPAQALADPAFDDVRDNDRFAALSARATPAPHNANLSGTLAAGSGADHVEISEHSGGTQINAGDVKLNTNF
jgi:hypothetical protein